MYLFLSIYLLLLTRYCTSFYILNQQRGACENNVNYCRCPTDQFLSCIGFPTFNELNFVSAITPLVDFLQLEPAVALKFDTSLNLAGIRLSSQSEVTLTNLNSLEFTFDPFEPVIDPTATRLKSLKLNATVLRFSFLNAGPLDQTACNGIQLGTNRKSIFSQFESIYLGSRVQYEPLCPFLFNGVDIGLLEISHLTETNRFEFIPINDIDAGFLADNSRVEKIEILESRIASLGDKQLPKSVFGQLRNLLISDSSLDHIDDDLFQNGAFPKLISIKLLLRDFKPFFKNGSTGWLAGLNSNNEVVQPQQQQLLVSFVDNNFPPYTYPESDLCLFAHFPHERQVYVEIRSDTHIYACTCTLIWLLKNWQNYTLFNLSNTAISYCLEPNRFQSLLISCKLDYAIDICLNPPTTPESTTTEPITTEPITTEEPKEPDFPLFYIIIGVVAFLLLVALILIVAFLIYRRKRKVNKVIRPQTPPSQDNTLALQVNYCSLIQHSIVLNQHHQFKIYDNKVDKKYKEESEDDVLALVRSNKVKRVSSGDNWLNAMYFIDNTNRLVIDFRKLNSCITDETDTTGRIDSKISLIKRLSGFSCFTVLELNDKFASQIYIDPKSRINTSFKTPSSFVYCYNTIPFGLKNGHVTARKTCDQILSSTSLNNCAVRIGDRLIIFALDQNENEANRNQINERFLEYNINMSNLNVIQNNGAQIEIFDSVISNSQVVPNPRKLTSIEFLKCFQTSDQFKLFQEFFATFSDHISDYYPLYSEQERLGKILFMENSPNSTNSSLELAAYNDFSKCFERIKSRISNLINKKEFTSNGVFNLCLYYTNRGRAMLLSSENKIVSLRYERNAEVGKISDKDVTNAETSKEIFTEHLLWALNELETNDISVDDQTAMASNNNLIVLPVKANTSRPVTALKAQRQPTLLTIKAAAKPAAILEPSTESVAKIGPEYIIHSKFSLLVENYFHNFQSAKLVKNLCLLQNYRVRFAVEKQQQFHSMLVRSYCKLLDSYESLY